MASILTSRYQPIASQAEITSKLKPDRQEIERRKISGISNAPNVFPGATAENMFAILAGEICMGRRGRKAEKALSGSFLESCLSSVAGLDASQNPEQVMREHYFVGIAKTVDMANDKDFYGDTQLEHGIAGTRHGSYSTANNNSWRYDINAGDWIEITLPPTNAQLGVVINPNNPALDTGLNIVQRNTMHAPVTKPLWQTVPFDPNRYASSRLGLWVTLAELKKGSNREIRRYMPDGRYPLSTLEEETGAMTLAVLGMLQRLKVLEKKKQINWKKNCKIVDGKFSDVNIDLVSNLVRPAQAGEDYVPGQWFDNMVRCVTGVYHCKAARILGVALNGAKPGEQLNVAIGIGRPGF